MLRDDGDLTQRMLNSKYVNHLENNDLIGFAVFNNTQFLSTEAINLHYILLLHILSLWFILLSHYLISAENIYN